MATPSSAPAHAGLLPPGHRIHEYQIEQSLGSGGFGITYLARDGNLDLPVAIKEYFPGDLAARAADQGVSVRGGGAEAQQSYDLGLERFLDEARVLATFRHPNIVRVLRYFRLNGTAYIVMEYESGLPLKRWAPQNAPLSRAALLSIVYPLLDGLEAVHKTGFLHRDIKPDNIYVRADGTPVLLDFGAARRVSADQAITNIVSPGFAPFEQYHSEGHQGPWTDVYSLGAVMYWMTTGRKPVDSASRVKADSMLPASSLAATDIFGSPLLLAIDWALQPDEASRPQTVPLFRAAIQGSEQAAPAPAGASPRVAQIAGGGEPVPSGASASSVSGPVNASGASGASGAAPKRNLLCTIMFLDLVGYSKRSVDDQVALKQLFNDLIGKAVMGVPEDTRISIDTGDGAAICFMGDPEEALRSAMLLRDLFNQRGALLSVRIGLHMGPVRVISDINNRLNVLGDGINVAQRVMDFAQSNQVLVSRSYYDVISRITDDTAGLFQYLGPRADKHGRVHEVYAVDAHQSAETIGRALPAAAVAAGVAAAGEATRTGLAPLPTLDTQGVRDIEVELSRHIGPLAGVLVRKAQTLWPTLEQLREALAPSIQDTAARESFIAGNSPGPSSQSMTRRATSPSGHETDSRSRIHPDSQPRHPDSRPVAETTRQLDIPPDELAVIELTLSKFIGPMARMLIRKEIGRCTQFKDFAVAVSLHIDQPPQRDVFLQALRRALPKRQY